MSLKTIWIDFCENGSIHGLRYVAQKDRNFLERYKLNVMFDIQMSIKTLFIANRFMWLLLVITASIMIVVLVSASWEKYSYSSMKIVVDDARYPLTKIDFPAVTICPINKIVYSRAANLVLKYIIFIPSPPIYLI